MLARQGIDPESIDIVINTHLHWDHCGGNTTLTAAGPVPAFPRARYLACRQEWEHAHELLHLLPPQDRGKDFLSKFIIENKDNPPSAWKGVWPATRR